MSESDAPRKLRLIAVGAALVALVFTLITVIVVLTRDGGQPSARAKQIDVTDQQVAADDVVKLQRNDAEIVVANGETKGVRLKDPALAKSLGLEPDDVITAISGKPMMREADAHEAILKLSLMSATTLYVEVTRKDKPVLLRWRLNGDLREARYGTRSNVFGSNPLSAYPPAPSYTPPSYATPDPADPLLDLIEKVDDTHVKVPRKVVDAMLANPMSIAKGARVVPSMRNGQADGLKLYAIRPSSVFAKLGFNNGDTVHSINGFELTSADKALEVYTKLRDATSLSFELTRRGKPIDLSIEITK